MALTINDEMSLADLLDRIERLARASGVTPEQARITGRIRAALNSHTGDDDAVAVFGPNVQDNITMGELRRLVG